MNTKAQLKKNFNMKMENIKDKEDVLYYYMIKFQKNIEKEGEYGTDT